MCPASSSEIVDHNGESQKNDANKHSTKLLRKRMFKLQQRELLISNIRNYCSLKLFSDSTDNFKSSSMPSIQQYKSQKSKDFKSEKRRKIPPISKQYENLSTLVVYLDMEWNDFEIILGTVQRFRILLSSRYNSRIDQIIQSGAIEYFLQYLTLKQVHKYFNVEEDNPSEYLVHNDTSKKSISVSKLYQLQFEACSAITVITRSLAEHIRYLVDIGCIPALIHLLDCEYDGLKNQSLISLGNISDCTTMMRDLVLDQGAMPKVIKILESETNIERKKLAMMAFKNLLRGKPVPHLTIVSVAIPVLASLLNGSDDEILTDACWAISYVCDGPNNRIQAVIEHDGLTRRLIELIDHTNDCIQTPAVISMGNLVTGNDSQVSYLLRCGLLDKLQNIINHPKNLIRKNVLYALSNITAGNTAQIQMIIDAGIIPKIISLVLSGSEPIDIAKEAYWVLSNLCTSGSDEQIKYAIDQDIIRVFCIGISVTDRKVISIILEALQSVLCKAEGQIIHVTDKITEYGGMDRIVNLQNHQDEIIRKLCSQILDDLDDNLME